MLIVLLVIVLSWSGTKGMQFVNLCPVGQGGASSYEAAASYLSSMQDSMTAKMLHSSSIECSLRLNKPSSTSQCGLQLGVYVEDFERHFVVQPLAATSCGEGGQFTCFSFSMPIAEWVKSCSSLKVKSGQRPQLICVLNYIFRYNNANFDKKLNYNLLLGVSYDQTAVEAVEPRKISGIAEELIFSCPSCTRLYLCHEATCSDSSSSFVFGDDLFVILATNETRPVTSVQLSFVSLTVTIKERGAEVVYDLTPIVGTMEQSATRLVCRLPLVFVADQAIIKIVASLEPISARVLASTKSGVQGVSGSLIVTKSATQKDYTGLIVAITVSVSIAVGIIIIFICIFRLYCQRGQRKLPAEASNALQTAPNRV